MAGMRLAMWFVLALTYELGHRAARGDSWVGVSTGQQFASAFTDPSFSTIYIEDDLMLRPGDWGLGCLPLTKNITVVGRAPSNTTYPVVHMGWLTRIIKLDPGVWLTFERITIKGFRPVMGPDFAFLCYSPDAFLYQSDVVVDLPIGVLSSLLVPSLLSTPRIGVPGVQAAHAWDESYCFDTVHTSQCYPESVHLVDFAGTVPGTGSSGGYVVRFMNSTDTAAEVLDPTCIEEYGSSQCYTDAVAAQIKIDFPSSPPPVPPPRPPKSPHPDAPFAPYPPVAPPASERSSVIVVVPAVVVPCVALLAIAAFVGWWFWRRRHPLPLHVRFPKPRAGPHTTLVVTDIQDSTNMWETLPGDVMDESLVTHNAIMRRCLSKYHGWESATEGDAFIMAFHTATDAVSFCLAVQEQLMTAEWPAELLAHASACEVYATPTKMLQLDFGMVETMKSMACNDSSHPGRITLARHNSNPNSMSIDSTNHPPPHTPPATLRTNALFNGAAAKSASKVSHSPSGNSSLLASADNLNALHMMLGAALESVVEGCGEDEGDAMLSNRTWLEHLRNGWLLRSGAKQVAGPDAAEGSFVDAGGDIGDLRHIGISNGQRLHLPQVRFNNELMMFRGLRVRMGVHSGVVATDISHNKSAARTQYVGPSLSRARNVCDATPGGAVLLSKAAFVAVTTEGGRKQGVVMAHVGDFQKEADAPPSSKPLRLYAAVRPELLARYVAGAPLKVAEKVSGGVFDAPVGSVTINFMYMPCHKTLSAWRPELADLAAATFSILVMACVHKNNGYVVEHDGGFCLSAFCRAVDAVIFCIDMKAAMMKAQWSAELLEHELCEEVTEGKCVVMRGPRVKSGTDSCSQVFTAINPSSGRMEYRGKVMNRAARIASKATSGVALVSSNCFAECRSAPEGETISARLHSTLDLKGIGKLEVVQLSMPLHLRIDAIRAFDSVGRITSHLPTADEAPAAPMSETASVGTQSDAMPVMQTACVGTQWEPLWEPQGLLAEADTGAPLATTKAPATLDTDAAKERTSL